MKPDLNPEFVRHVWLDLTPQRLIATPLILAMVFVISTQLEGLVGEMPSVAMMIFIGMTGLWGAKLAGDSLNNELTQGTWDSQRLSGMGAWQMTVGKLGGGPVFAWYGGALCLLVFAATSDWNLESLRKLLTAVSAAVALHAGALLAALVGWRKQPRTTATPRSRGASILLLLVFAPQMFMLIGGRENAGEVIWYGWHIAFSDFVLLCAVLAMFWATLGLYRVMREELSFRDPPNAWIAFLLFLCGFTGGFFHGRVAGYAIPELSPLLAHLAFCVLLMLLATYALLFGERKDWVKLRRLADLARGGRFREAWEITPKWLASLALSGAAVGILALACVATLPPMSAIAKLCTAAGFFAFLVRDGALVLGLNFVRDQSRADAAAAVYLMVLYALLPGLLNVVGLHFVAAVFWPTLIHEQPVWLVLVLAQAAVALDFAIRRWRRLPA
ncbi:MAG: hypothetical protein K0Q76_3527 [Panacagrimonas sp.]|jgi:hypothetical protein|nr:hypothetical protein [Panacagrimonas sp.]MCC2658419.1 hypothetical protein [Panacagrimonas sp.]